MSVLLIGGNMPAIDRLITLLVYENIPAAHDFLVDAFGFVSGGIERNDQGTPVHAEVRAGEAVIWLHRVAPDHQLLSPRALPGVSGGTYVEVDDVDAQFTRARAGGADVDGKPRAQPYGTYEFRARDIEGHHWWFGRPVTTGTIREHPDA